jgi:hypothetical protein
VKGPKETNLGALIKNLQNLNVEGETLRQTIANLKGTKAEIDVTGLNLDGVTISNPSGLKFKATRTPDQVANGEFSCSMNHMTIEGGTGAIIFEGIDCTKARIANLKAVEPLTTPALGTWLQFRECQLAGAKALKGCSVNDVAMTDCSFGRDADFSCLELKKEITDASEFKARFGGSIWITGKVKFHKSLGFDDHKDAINDVPRDKTPAILLAALSDSAHCQKLFGSNLAQAKKTGAGFSVELPFGGELRFKLGADAAGLPVIMGVAHKSNKGFREFWTRKNEGVGVSGMTTEKLMDEINRILKMARKKEPWQGLSVDATEKDLVADYRKAQKRLENLITSEQKATAKAAPKKKAA